MKTIGQLSENDFEEAGGWLKRQTPLGLALKIVLVFVVIGLLGAGCGLVGGWFGEAKRQVSVQNVKARWQFAYDYDRSLAAIAGQWCTAKKAEAAATDPNERIQRTSQRIAIENNYNRVEAQYDAALRDAFRSKYIRPSDVPTQAPLLQDQPAAQTCA